MESYIYNYETWLDGHANRKTMMEKLERSLVPYELFEAIGLKNDKQPMSGEIALCLPWQHLPKPDGGVCDEGSAGEGGAGRHCRGIGGVTYG